MILWQLLVKITNRLLKQTQEQSISYVIRRKCGQTWTRVRVKTLDNY